MNNENFVRLRTIRDSFISIRDPRTADIAYEGLKQLNSVEMYTFIMYLIFTDVTCGEIARILGVSDDMAAMMLRVGKGAFTSEAFEEEFARAMVEAGSSLQ